MSHPILESVDPDLVEARAKIAEASASLERAMEVGDSPELRAAIARLDRIEAEYRKRGLGRQLLARLEERVAALGIAMVWTLTAGYEAPAFYESQGYARLGELPGYYESGHARVALGKATGR